MHGPIQSRETVPLTVICRGAGASKKLKKTFSKSVFKFYSASISGSAYSILSKKFKSMRPTVQCTRRSVCFPEVEGVLQPGDSAVVRHLKMNPESGFFLNFLSAKSRSVGSLYFEDLSDTS